MFVLIQEFIDISLNALKCGSIFGCIGWSIRLKGFNSSGMKIFNLPGRILYGYLFFFSILSIFKRIFGYYFRFPDDKLFFFEKPFLKLFNMILLTVFRRGCLCCLGDLVIIYLRGVCNNGWFTLWRWNFERRLHQMCHTHLFAPFSDIYSF